MNNAYRNFMDQQCLSEQAKQAFYYNLQRAERKKPYRFLLKAAVVAACIILMIPITVFAIEAIFDISVVEIISGNTITSKFGTGFAVNYPSVSSRPLSDFSEDIQTMDGRTTAIYNSWKEAEVELGITLVNNTILSNENISKAYVYNLKSAGISKRVHCYAVYNGMDSQLYRAEVTAAYRYKEMRVTLNATVTCEHPGIPPERENQLHWSGVMYGNHDVAEVSQEEYVASNGIPATIITISKTRNNDRDYRACFATNGVSYIITVSPHDLNHPEEARDVLIDIIEAFTF